MRLLVVGMTALLVACASPRTDVEVQPLVDAAWLNAHLDDLIVLDIRNSAGAAEDRETYETGHIPGAIHSGYGQDRWRVTRDSVPGMAPLVLELEQLIGGLGISNEDYVVIVPAGTSAREFASATRVYWQFKVLGHERVSILDGGFEGWKAAEYAVTTESLELEPVSYSADYQPQLVASREDVIAALENGTQLIDARLPSYYVGESKSRLAARAGTIAGAKNVPAGAMTVENGGTFVDSVTAASFWDEAGAKSDGEQIVFCNTGHLASLTWFTAYEVLGDKQARLYDGSLAEWSADTDLPMDNSGQAGR